MPVAQRYGTPFAEDYKEKLTAEIEGREWVPTPRKPQTQTQKQFGGSITTTTKNDNRSRSSTPILPVDQKAGNEDYFNRLGTTNAARPDSLPPSQGGKFSGFGSTPIETLGDAHDSPFEDVAATISRRFWGLAATMNRAAKTANEQFIQPTAQKIAESELTNAAVKQATILGQKVTETAHYGVESARRYVDNAGKPGYRPVNSGAGGGWQGGPDLDHQGFWDTFGTPGDGDGQGDDERFYDRDTKSGALGTSAMRKVNSSNGGSTTAVGGGSITGGTVKKVTKSDDGWDDW